MVVAWVLETGEHHQHYLKVSREAVVNEISNTFAPAECELLFNTYRYLNQHDRRAASLTLGREMGELRLQPFIFVYFAHHLRRLIVM